MPPRYYIVIYFTITRIITILLCHTIALSQYFTVTVSQCHDLTLFIVSVVPTDAPVVDDGNDTTTIIVVIVVVAVVLGVVVTVIIVKKRRSGSGNGTTNGN